MSNLNTFKSFAWRTKRPLALREGLAPKLAFQIETLERRLLFSGTTGQLFVVSGPKIGQYTTSGATINSGLGLGPDQASGIAISGSDLFVANIGLGTVEEYKTSGAPVNVSLISGLGGPRGIAISGSDIFVTNFQTGTVGEYTTSGVTLNASLITGLNGPDAIAISGPDLFVGCTGTGTIGEYTTGGVPVNASLVSGVFPNGIAVSGSDLFVSNSSLGVTPGWVSEYTTSGSVISSSLISAFGAPDYAEPTGIAVSGSDLFITQDPPDTGGDGGILHGFIAEYTTSGTPVNTSVASELPVPSGLAISGSYVFVAYDGDTIGQYTTSGATVEAALISGLGVPQGVAVSGSDVFVASHEGTISEFTTSGVTVNASLISGLDGPTWLAVSGPDLFVVDAGSATIGEYTTSGATVNASLISGLDGGPEGIAISGSDLFVADEDGAIAEYTTSGALVNPSLVSGLGRLTGLAVSGSDLYVVNENVGGISEYTTAGAMVNQSLVSGLSAPQAIAVLGSDLFVTTIGNFTDTSGAIGEYTTGGAAVNGTLISGLDFPYAIGVEGSDAAGAATRLMFGPQPSALIVNTPAPDMPVDVEDVNGNIASEDNSSITLSIASGPTGGALGGSTAVAAQAGIATFSNLSFSKPGTYTLIARDGDLSADGSMSIDVITADTVLKAPSVTGNPLDQSKYAGDAVTFSASASGDPPPTVQWQVSTDGGNTFGDISGATSTSYSFTVSSNQDGYEYRAVFTNSSGSIATNAATLTVTSGPPPSPSPISPVFVGVKLPAAVVAGGKLSARVPISISNQGDAFTGSVRVNIYADTGTSLDGSQVLITSLSKKLSLKSGKGAVVNFNIKSLPSSLPNGSYHLLAEVVDPSGNSSLAATTQTIQLAAPFVQPAVLVGAVTPSSIAGGKSGTVAVTVTNDGNVAGSGITITLNPSDDGSTPLDVILESLRSGAKILPGKSKTFKLHFKLNSALPAGSYIPYVSVSLGGVDSISAGATQFTVT